MERKWKTVLSRLIFITFSEYATKFKWLVQNSTTKRNDHVYGIKYSIMDQVKFMEYSLQKT